MRTLLHWFTVLTALAATPSLAKQELSYALTGFVKFNSFDGRFEFKCPETSLKFTNNFRVVWGYGDDDGHEGWDRGIITPVHSNGYYSASFELPEYTELPTVYGCELINNVLVKRAVLLQFAKLNDRESIRLRKEFDDMVVNDLAGFEYAGKHDSAAYLWARSRVEFTGTFDYLGSKADSFSKWTNAYKVIFYQTNNVFRLDEQIRDSDGSVSRHAKNYLLALAQNNKPEYARVIYGNDEEWFYKKNGDLPNRWLSGYTEAKFLCHAQLHAIYGDFYCVYYRLSSGSGEETGNVKYGLVPCFKGANALQVCNGYDSKMFRLFEACGISNHEAFDIMPGGPKSEILPKVRALPLPASFTTWP